MTLTLVPLGLREANAFVGEEHRHHGPVRGYKFALGATAESRLVGVIIVGRTTARGHHATSRAEVTRLATDGTRNACSFLYAAAKRVVQAMGYTSLITYTLTTEPIARKLAPGARNPVVIRGRSWHCVSRPRIDKHPIGDKLRWELIGQEGAA
jgi:hypothetical protein